MVPKVLPPAHQVVPAYSTCKTFQISRSIMCSVCQSSTNSLIRNRQPRKTERCKSNRRQCKELWLKSRSILSLTPGEKLLQRLQCRYLGCDFTEQGNKLTKEQPSTHENVSKASIMNETEQPSLDESTAPTNIVVLHTNAPPINNQRETNNIVMLHHETPNHRSYISAPNNVRV